MASPGLFEKPCCPSLWRLCLLRSRSVESPRLLQSSSRPRSWTSAGPRIRQSPPARQPGRRHRHRLHHRIPCKRPRGPLQQWPSPKIERHSSAAHPQEWRRDVRWPGSDPDPAQSRRVPTTRLLRPLPEYTDAPERRYLELQGWPMLDSTQSGATLDGATSIGQRPAQLMGAGCRSRRWRARSTRGSAPHRPYRPGGD
jgi:hypothetical protein